MLFAQKIVLDGCCSAVALFALYISLYRTTAVWMMLFRITFKDDPGRSSGLSSLLACPVAYTHC